MMNHNEIADFLWKIADLVKDDYEAKDYEDVQRWVHARYRYIPLPAWIAHVKELLGLQPRRAWNRRGRRRTLCPPEKRAAIEAGLRQVKSRSR